MVLRLLRPLLYIPRSALSEPVVGRHGSIEENVKYGNHPASPRSGDYRLYTLPPRSVRTA